MPPKKTAKKTAKLANLHWSALVYSIKERQCILMLGPEAVKEVPEQGPPRSILAAFAEELRSSLATASSGKDTYFELGQDFALKSGYHSLRASAAEFFRRKRQLQLTALERLAELPFPLIVTTLPGDEVEQVLRTRGKEPVSDFYNFRGPSEGRFAAPSTEAPLVFHLYGAAEKPESLVLSENDLLDFLVAVISKDPDVREDIRSQFKDPRKCFLFLGFGFSHWCLRILLHALHEPRPEAHSYAIEQFDRSLPAATIENTIQFFQRGHHINFFDMDLDEFTGELSDRVGKVFRPTTAQLPEDAPTLFISHASEDRGAAIGLTDELTKGGIQPWLDVRELEPGASWSDRIKRTIETTDYFLVLQSRNLVDKKRGYVNRELNLALDQQLSFRRGELFIIPSRIDDSAPLAEFKDLQYVDLRTQGAIRDLIQTIQRDFRQNKSASRRASG